MAFATSPAECVGSSNINWHVPAQYGHFHLGNRATAADVAADAVVLATGSECRAPDMSTDGSTPSISVHDLAQRIEQSALPRGARAVLFDFDHTAPTYAAARMLDAFLK